MTHKTFAVIGAGIAGLACARRLEGLGRKVKVFDKGRAPGGRIATRRVETAQGVAQFDHGAQYFTVRDPAFAHAVAALPADAADAWGAGDWRVGRPGMSAFARALASGLDVRASTRVTEIRRDGPRWRLIGEDGALPEAFDAVIVATPAEQAAPLLALVAPDLAREASSAATAPTWAGLFAFAAPPARAPDHLDLPDHPVLSWVACDSAKPGRGSDLSCWVAHAGVAWTRAHLELSPEDASAHLRAALASVLGPLPDPVLAQAHRWRYARVERAAGSPFAWDAELGVGVCGDWRLGARVELAWRSGHELATAVCA